MVVLSMLLKLINFRTLPQNLGLEQPYSELLVVSETNVCKQVSLNML